MSTIDPNSFALRIGMDLFKARQPLAAALVYAEIAGSGYSTPELWCGLGASLLASRGQFVRTPFEVWAAKVFRRGEPGFGGTPYAAVVQDWLPALPDYPNSQPLSDAEIPEMIEFLQVNEAVLPGAVATLAPDAAMSVVMALGDRAHPLYLPLLRAAVEGKLGDGAGRSALKRVGPFLDRPEMLASLLVASTSPRREELEPYLKFLLQRLPEGWDQPRTSPCPPYQGIGKIDIELVAVGTDPSAVAAVLQERLGAVDRDVSSWMAQVPCMMKRGAMRDDALRLQLALEPLGAKVELHGFTYSGEPAAPKKTPEAAQKKPWWKFW